MNLGPQSSLSLIRILGSLSKTLGIIRQISPIYKDIKPLIDKAPLLFKRINTVREATYTLKETIGAQTEQIKTIDNHQNKYGPNFFH